jgi:hypothetical protein
MVMSPPQIRERYHSKIQVTQRNQEVPGQTLRSARFTCPTGRASATTSSRERDHRPRSNKASDCRAERQIARPPVEDLARQRLSLPQGDAAEHDRRSPRKSFHCHRLLGLTVRPPNTEKWRVSCFLVDGSPTLLSISPKVIVLRFLCAGF